MALYAIPAALADLNLYCRCACALPVSDFEVKPWAPCEASLDRGMIVKISLSFAFAWTACFSSRPKAGCVARDTLIGNAACRLGTEPDDSAPCCMLSDLWHSVCVNNLRLHSQMIIDYSSYTLIHGVAS